MRLLLALSVLIVALACEAASITTNIYSVGGFSTNDYRSLSTWEAGRQANLTTGDGTCEFVQCFATNDNYAVAIDGWTTAPNNFIYIYAHPTARHAGVLDTSKFYITAAGSVIVNSEDYVVIDGIQIVHSTPTADTRACIYINALSAGANTMTIRNCILKQSGNGTYIEPGIYSASANNSFNLINSIIYGIGTGSTANTHVGILAAGTTINIYSSTIIGGKYGINRSSGTVTAKNCYALGTTGAYNGTIGQTTCAANDTTADGTALDNIAFTTSNFANVTGGSENLHLVAGSALINVGTDTSGESAPLNFTTDIDGQTRSGTWDVGADEYVAAGGASAPKPTYLLKGTLR